MMTHPRYFAENNPDKPAYIMGKSGQVVTYSQLERRANRCSQYFRDIGLQPKGKIAIFMENNIRFMEIVRAAHVAGLHYVALSSHLKQTEIEYILEDSEAELLVTSHFLKDTAAQLAASTPRVKHKLMVDGTSPGFESYEDTVKKYPDTPIPECIDGRDMLYSSGTTGRPKGVIQKTEDQPFGTVHPSVQVAINLFQLNKETVFLSPAPLYHTAPLRVCMWTLQAGGTVVVMEKFDAELALSLIDRFKVTHTQWVPTMFIRTLKLPEAIRNNYDVSSLKVCIHGAAPCPLEVKEQMMAWWGPILYELYAGTEGNVLVIMFPNDWYEHKGSVGKSFVGVLHILDDSDDELPLGTPGNVFVEDGNAFEYHNDPEKTAASVSKQGWNTMGDIGYLDQEGFLYLTDRKGYTINSGGVNIYPQEIENMLAVHDKVLDAAVFGIPNQEFGEEVKAVVLPVDMKMAGPELEQELIAYCRESLSHIKCPKSIDFKAEFPRTGTGKLMKRFLIDEYSGGKKA
jgi:acyl-CoA synthetase (AMP-forming)/AMP-acid ligase II